MYIVYVLKLQFNKYCNFNDFMAAVVVHLAFDSYFRSESFSSPGIKKAG